MSYISIIVEGLFLENVTGFIIVVLKNMYHIETPLHNF